MENEEKFMNILFEKVIYENGKVIVDYKHKEYKKKLVFENVKSAKLHSWSIAYYDSLLDKMETDKGFYKMINRAPKYNEIYLIDANWDRIIIKFKD